MKIESKILTGFGVLAVLVVSWGLESDYGIFSGIYNDIKLAPQRREYTKQHSAERAKKQWDELQKKEKERQQKEFYAQKIKAAGVCFDAVKTAASMYEGYGRVRDILDVPTRTGGDKGMSKCSVKVRVGDMYIQDRKAYMYYQVLHNNGYYQVLYSIMTDWAN